jgi:DnaK suppressor protein
MGAKSTVATAVKKGAAKVSGKAPLEADIASATLEAPPVVAPIPKTGSKPGKLLTEEEILRAPEKDYMNASQLAFFRHRLQEMEQDILRNAGETTEHLRETIIVPDPADRATIEEEHALELRTRDRERKLLKKIQQSIVRIDSGDYGYCEETGDPIGIPRLLARPTATLSLEAQERREMKQKMYGE